jgi:signal transduction histidine kinase
VKGVRPLGEILRIPVDRELGERVRWLITVRWLVLLLAGGILLVADRWLGIALPQGPLWLTLGGVLAYNLAFWVMARRLTRRHAPYETHAILLHLQILADLVALTVVLHFSGGLENPFAAYYVAEVVIGSILTSRRASFLYALIASALWVALLLLEAGGLLPHFNLAGYRLPTRFREPVHIVSESFVLTSLNLAVAYFSSTILARLREGQQQLYEANSSCEIRAGELAALNERLRLGQEQLFEANSACELRAGELVALNERLSELDRSRSLFIRLVTHELRAPVAAIQSYLRLILDGYVGADRLHEIVAKAEQRARDQLDLISDLLDLARVQDPKGVTPPCAVNATAILQDVLDLMQVRAQDKSLSLTVEVAPDVPQVLASTEHVKQVWTNLVSNAIKYTPEKGQVTVTLQPAGDMVRGTVRDTGIGIAPDEQAHVFETFYRTEAAKAMSHQGTGLGLSIVAGIMGRYGGRIWVESTVGQGSTFSFELPQAK